MSVEKAKHVMYIYQIKSQSYICMYVHGQNISNVYPHFLPIDKVQELVDAYKV